MSEAPYKPRVTRDGQGYFDRDVLVMPKEEQRPSMLELSVAAAFNGGEVPSQLQRQPIVLGYERIKLNWMKPDGKGGLARK